MPEAYLGGKPIVGESPASWALSTGVAPYIAEFVLGKEDAIALQSDYAGMRPIELQLEGQTYKRLRIIGVGRSRHPNLMPLLVADTRFLWTRAWIGPRHYNIRRADGKRWAGDVDILDNLVDSIRYASFSLIGRTKAWIAAEVMDDVFKALLGKLERLTGETFTRTQIPAGVLARFRPEDLIINDRGDRAVQRVLDFFGGLGVLLDANGDIQITTTLSGAEVGVVSGSSGFTAGDPIPTWQDRSHQRPRWIDVYFRREIEVRFDFDETAGTTVSLVGEDPRELENVIEVVDPTMTIGGETYTYGSWVPISTWVSALSGSQHYLSLPDLSTEIIRTQWPSGLLLVNYSAGYDGVAPDPDWVRRIMAIMRHYRQTYRIPRHWMDRVLSWTTQRAALIDPATARRATSQPFQGWAIQWPIAPNAIAMGSGEWLGIQNVEGYADDISTAKPAPGGLQILSQDEGIFRVGLTDTWGQYARTFPSQVALPPYLIDTGPDSLIALNQAPDAMALTEEHKLAVILTCTPASPSGTQSLHRIRVYPSDVERLTGRSLGDCLGPGMELYCTSATARFAWDDAQAEQIESAFGNNAADDQYIDLSEVLLDEEQLKTVAAAVSAQVLDELPSRFEGSMTLPGRAPIPIGGSIEEVEVSIGTDGGVTTTATMPPPRLVVDFFSYLDDGTRKQLFRQLGG